MTAATQRMVLLSTSVSVADPGDDLSQQDGWLGFWQHERLFGATDTQQQAPVAFISSVHPHVRPWHESDWLDDVTIIGNPTTVAN